MSGSKGKEMKEEVRRLPFKVLRVALMGSILASGIVGSICGFRLFHPTWRIFALSLLTIHIPLDFVYKMRLACGLKKVAIILSAALFTSENYWRLSWHFLLRTLIVSKLSASRTAPLEMRRTRTCNKCVCAFFVAIKVKMRPRRCSGRRKAREIALLFPAYITLRASVCIIYELQASRKNETPHSLCCCSKLHWRCLNFSK